MKENFHQQVNTLRGDSGMRRKIVIVLDAALYQLAKEGLIDPLDIKETLAVASEALVQDTESIKEEDLLELNRDAILMHWQNLGIYSDALAAALKEKSEQLLRNPALTS